MESFEPPNQQNIFLNIIICCIICYNRQRERSYLTSSALLHPRQSPWQRLLIYGDDSSFLRIKDISPINGKVAYFQINRYQENLEDSDIRSCITGWNSINISE